MDMNLGHTVTSAFLEETRSDSPFENLWRQYWVASTKDHGWPLDHFEHVILPQYPPFP